jgi:ferrous iron transport protein B
MSIIVWCLQSFSFDFSYVKYSNKSSMLESLGKILSPIFLPLGFSSWGITSALIAGIVAKEIIISSIAIFNGVSSNNPNFMQSVANSLKVGSRVVFFTPASALSFMVFCLLYTPCVSTMMALKSEIGKKWTIICIALQFVLAYITAMVVFALFNAITWLGIINSILIVVAILLFLGILKKLLGKKNRCKARNCCIGCHFCK